MIDTIEVASRSRANMTHTVYTHNGKAVGCTCKWRQYHPWTPCHHMEAYEQRKRDEERTRYIYYCLQLGI